jgi:hypothetical protein
MKQIEFTSYYNLIAHITSDIHENRTASEVAKALRDEATGIKDYDMASVFAHLEVFIKPQVQQMEALRSDIYTSVLLSMIKAFDDDAEIKSLEMYVRHIVGLDSMALRYDISKEKYVLGFLFEEVQEDFISTRISILTDIIKNLMTRSDDMMSYPKQRLKDMLVQLIDSATEINGCDEALKLAKQLLDDNSRMN